MQEASRVSSVAEPNHRWRGGSFCVIICSTIYMDKTNPYEKHPKGNKKVDVVFEVVLEII